MTRLLLLVELQVQWTRLIDNDKVEVEIAENVTVEIIKSTGIQSLVNTNTQEVKK